MAQPVLIAPARHRERALGGVRRVAFLLSSLLLAAVGTMAAPLAVSIGYGEPETIRAFATTMFIGAAVGTVGFFALRSDLADLTRREGIAVVALGWLLVCAVGSLPYILNGILGPVDAWFECTSGFSTQQSRIGIANHTRNNHVPRFIVERIERTMLVHHHREGGRIIEVVCRSWCGSRRRRWCGGHRVRLSRFGNRCCCSSTPRKHKSQRQHKCCSPPHFHRPVFSAS